jgi:hypothetical protein
MTELLPVVGPIDPTTDARTGADERTNSGEAVVTHGRTTWHERAMAPTRDDYAA